MVKTQKTMLVVSFILSAVIITTIIIWFNYGHLAGNNKPSTILRVLYHIKLKERGICVTYGINNEKRYVTEKNDIETAITAIEIDGYWIEKHDAKEHKIYIQKDGVTSSIIYKPFLDEYTMYYLPYGSNSN